MDLAACNRLRRLLGYLGAGLSILFFAVLADTLAQNFSGEFNTFDIVAGESVALGGPMPEYAPDIGHLAVHGVCQGLELHFLAEDRSYWHGGRIWRGRLVADPWAQTGTCQLQVRAQADVAQLPALVFNIRTFASAQERQQAASSVVRRNLDMEPGALALAAGLAAALTYAAVFGLSQRIGRLMAAMGRSEIFFTKEVAGTTEITFGMGTGQGLAEGDQVWITDATGQPKARATVLRIQANAATARTAPRLTLRGDDEVRLRPAPMVAIPDRVDRAISRKQ